MRLAGILAVCAAVVWTAQTKPVQSDAVPPETQADKSKEEASQILFGERGILTGIFRMMDQQRKIKPEVQQDTSDSGKIGKFDFKKIVDTLVTGADKGELGDHGVELPEVLGICNRLSCGDIYKAIDKFRKSDMFSNFQTALTLVQDPNGWETIGKLLSNPELIAQFTAGNGMEELFGSALGEMKKESNITKSKNSGLIPEDGDFGIDFSEDEEGTKVATKDKDAKVEFSIDSKLPSEDYYGEVAAKGDESAEYETVDETPPSKPITKSTEPEKKASEKLPPISFSIDEGGDEENETAMAPEQKPPPVSTRVVKRINAGSVDNNRAGGATIAQERNVRPFSAVKIISSTSTTTVPTTTRRPLTTTRPRTTTTRRPTTTTRNFRKDNDYYDMYYDSNDKL